jgi:leader peptidase (prepilin peptidase)/N-methyltransferase
MISAATAILFASLALAAWIDFSSLRLPDWITLPLVAGGLVITCATGGKSEALSHLAGAAGGFFLFWGIAKIYRLLRKRDGLGLGDAKLLAAAGAWLGPELLAPVILASSLFGIAYVGARYLCGITTAPDTAIPFGPFISVSFFQVWCAKEFWHYSF